MLHTGFSRKINFIEDSGLPLLENLKILDKAHCENVSFIFNQLISSNSATPICVFLSSCKQKLTQLF